MWKKSAIIDGENANRSVISRRSLLALMLGAGVSHSLEAAPPPAAGGGDATGTAGNRAIRLAPPAGGGDAARTASDRPIRLALSESMVTEVNLDDARAAMLIWMKQLEKDVGIPIEVSPKVFEPTAEIVRLARRGLFDAVALNIVEYRQIADVLDSSQIMAESDAEERYMLLVKRGGGIRSLGDLRGRRLSMLGSNKMCIAPQWLSTILNDGHFPQSDQFFSSVTEDPKAARVVLPVFFGQTDACVTSRKSFALMCELNPQVGKDLTAIAESADLIVSFEIFHKNYQGANRDRFARIYSSEQNAPSPTAVRKQLGALFHFNGLSIRDSSSLEPALAMLDKSERISQRPGRPNLKP